MTIELLDPEPLPKYASFSQVAVATGTRVVFISGQVAEGEDLAAQAPAVYRNLATALEAAGLRPTDVAKLTMYVVGYREEFLPAMNEARRAVFGDHRPASTLVGVAALARPGWLIEVEATAVAG